MSDQEKTQYCPKCKTDKPADTDHFYNDGKSKTGLSCWCKECQRAVSKAAWEKKQAAKKGISAAKITTEPVPAKQKIKQKPPAPAKDLVLHLDFSNHEILLTDIKTEAAIQFRTPEMQAMWRIFMNPTKRRL